MEGWVRGAKKMGEKRGLERHWCMDEKTSLDIHILKLDILFSKD